MPPTPHTPPTPTRTPLFPPTPPKRGSRRLAVYLACGVALLFVPLTLQYQNHRAQEIRSRHPGATPAAPAPPRTVEETGDQSQPSESRQWHMQGLDGITEAQARTRFGKPMFSRDYNVTYGAFLGPEFGLKHYFLNESPGFDERLKGAATVWNYPQYTAIREMIWKMRESYLTLWLAEPRVEVSLQNGTADALFPRTKAGDWVVIDNYRVGQDLVRNLPASGGPDTAPPPVP